MFLFEARGFGERPRERGDVRANDQAHVIDLEAEWRDGKSSPKSSVGGSRVEYLRINACTLHSGRHGDITAPWDAKPHPRMPHRPRMPPGCGRGARSLRHPRIILKIHASQDTPNASQDALASLRMPSRLPGCAHPETPSPCISGCWHPETPPPPPKMIPALPGMVSPALGARVSQGASIAS